MLFSTSTFPWLLLSALTCKLWGGGAAAAAQQKLGSKLRPLLTSAGPPLQAHGKKRERKSLEGCSIFFWIGKIIQRGSIRRSHLALPLFTIRRIRIEPKLAEIEFCQLTTCMAERSSRKAQTASAPDHPVKKKIRSRRCMGKTKCKKDSPFLSEREWKTLRSHIDSRKLKSVYRPAANIRNYPTNPHNSGNPKDPKNLKNP